MDRVLQQIRAWREDLINLNRNNRLLYFRKTKTSTLHLVSPPPGGLRSQVEAFEQHFAKDAAFDRDLLGRRYDGYRTDFVALADDLNWAEQVRGHLGSPVATEVASRVLGISVSEHAAIPLQLATWGALEARILDEFDDAYRLEVAAEFETPFADLRSFLAALAGSVDDISEWGAYSTALSTLAAKGMKPAADYGIRKKISSADVAGMIRRSALESWIDAVRKTDSRLEHFMSRDRDHLARTFQELDRRMIAVASAKVIDACNSKRPTLGAGAAGLIASEANKQKRHMPIRHLIDQAAPVVQALKPCMTMSPLSVSQFLPSSMHFDIVIFDEASQVKPADAVNCIYRGRQLVIAGDQKQLPPTPFFDKVDTAAGDDWEDEQLDDYESVLDVAKGSGIRSMPLRWHYRSQHEDLITYSNYSFYDGQLVTFPSISTDAADRGIELYVVPGVYRRGGARDTGAAEKRLHKQRLRTVGQYFYYFEPTESVEGRGVSQ